MINRGQFIDAIRREGETFRVDQVVVKTGKDELRGKGSIRVSGDDFVLRVTLDDLLRVPSSVTGVFGYSEFWEIQGIIEDQLKFLLRDLPSQSSQHYGENPHATVTFRSNLLELVPSGYDCLTRDEIAQKQAVAKAQAGSQSTDGPALIPNPQCPQQELPRVTFYAVLANFEIIAKTAVRKQPRKTTSWAKVTVRRRTRVTAKSGNGVLD
jgi:hypothetical protein